MATIISHRVCPQTCIEAAYESTIMAVRSLFIFPPLVAVVLKSERDGRTCALFPLDDFYEHPLENDVTRIAVRICRKVLGKFTEKRVRAPADNLCAECKLS